MELFIDYDFENINIIINELSAKEQFVVCRVFGINGFNQLGQEEIAIKLGICQAQVSRLKDKVLFTIRRKIKNEVD